MWKLYISNIKLTPEFMASVYEISGNDLGADAMDKFVQVKGILKVSMYSEFVHLLGVITNGDK